MEIEKQEPYVFQVDSKIVQDIYKNEDNFLISYNENCKDKSTCAVYFSSNDIYYPNKEEVFKERIIDKNFFEWYGTRIQNVYKHILIRDVHKQWYLSGINNEVNSPEKLVEFLLHETKGYSIITVGSSAGGYASVLYGSMINAKKAIVFNAQFEIKTLLDSSVNTTDPFIFRYRKLPVFKYYDIKPFVNDDLEVFYFMSVKSKWDSEQCEHVNGVKNIHVLKFDTKHHGIPFLKSALGKVLNLDGEILKKYTKSINNPIVFTIRMIGLIKTFQGAKKQLLYKYRKKK